jgi:hypothetical protein
MFGIAHPEAPANDLAPRMSRTQRILELATCAVLLTACGSEYQPYTSAPETATVPLEALLVRAGANSTGSGTVVGSGIDCAISGTSLINTCAASIRRGNVATLKASATGGSSFLAWGDACVAFGSNPTCTVTLSEALAVTASFAAPPPPPPPPPPPTYLVSVRAATNSAGGGTVTAVGINCTISGTIQSGDCSETLTQGAQLTLTAAASGGGSFLGWSGACASAGVAATCTIIVNQALNVDASFAAPPKPPPPPPPNYPVTVRAAATSGGTGTVTGTGISCSIAATSASGDCAETFPEGTRLTLTAAATGVGSFSAWGGACAATSSGATCTLTVSQNLNVDVDFAPPPTYVVSVVAGSSGTGTGTVTGSGISCSISGTSQSGDCSETVVKGTGLTLTSTVTGGSTFAGWSGACSGAGAAATCSIVVNAATSVGASFTAPPPPNVAGFWSGSDAGVNIHYHVTLAQSGAALSLPACVPGDCRLTALTSTGSGWLGGSYADIVSLTGSASATSVSFIMNLGDRTVKFEGALTTPTRMVGQVSGPMMPTQSLTIDRQ